MLFLRFFSRMTEQRNICLFTYSFTCVCMSMALFSIWSIPESQVQLGSGDGGDDSRIVFLGLHRDSNPGRIHLLQARSQQVVIFSYYCRPVERNRLPSSLSLYVLLLFLFCYYSSLFYFFKTEMKQKWTPGELNEFSLYTKARQPRQTWLKW